MKTKEQIINQEPVFLNNWSHKIDVISDFEGIHMSYSEYMAEDAPYPNTGYWEESKSEMQKALDLYKGVNILFASYGQDNYSGDAWVLFEEDGELYEVNGSHCSCYGLEGQWGSYDYDSQWEPERVSLLELENRLLNGTFGEDDWSDNNFKEQLCKFLGVSFRKNL